MKDNRFIPHMRLGFVFSIAPGCAILSVIFSVSLLGKLWFMDSFSKLFPPQSHISHYVNQHDIDSERKEIRHWQRQIFKLLCWMVFGC